MLLTTLSNNTILLDTFDHRYNDYLIKHKVIFTIFEEIRL